LADIGEGIVGSENSEKNVCSGVIGE